MKKLWTAFLVVGGIVFAAFLGWVVQTLTAESIPMQQTPADVGYDLAPDGKQAKKANSGISNEHPLVAVVDANGKVKIISGKPSSSGGEYRVNNKDSAGWDD